MTERRELLSCEGVTLFDLSMEEAARRPIPAPPSTSVFAPCARKPDLSHAPCERLSAQNECVSDLKLCYRVWKEPQRQLAHPRANVALKGCRSEMVEDYGGRGSGAVSHALPRAWRGTMCLFKLIHTYIIASFPYCLKATLFFKSVLSPSTIE